MALIIHIHNDYSSIAGGIAPGVFKEIREALSYKKDGYQFSPSYNTFRKDGTRIWDGSVCLYKKRKKIWSFPTGMVSVVREILNKYNLKWQYADHRNHLESNADLSLADWFINNDGDQIPIALRDYQDQTVDAAFKRQRGLIKIATGGGKTICGAAIIAAVSRVPAIFYVLSKDLMYQTIVEFKKFLWQSGSNLEVGQIGDGICDIRDINVCTIQTCARAIGKKFKNTVIEGSNKKEKKVKDQHKKDIIDLIKSAKLIIVDEVHHVAADMCQSVVEASADAVYRYGLSASPWRDDGLDMLIESCFGRYIIDINASYLIQQGYLIKPYIYFLPVDASLGVFKTYHEYYTSYIVNNSARNAIASECATKLASEGHSVLMLVKHIEHGEILSDMTEDSIFISGRDNSKKRKQVIQDLKDGNQKIAVASTIADEGLDIPNLSALILAGSGKSSTRALQRVGRVLRPDNVSGKKTATVIDFRDKAKYLSKHYRSRKNIYKTESEFVIVEK